jgi:hypothetical protein
MLTKSKIALSLVRTRVTMPAVLIAIVVIVYSGIFQTTAAPGAVGIDYAATIVR